jgi:signal transduction histidine kinase
MSQLGLGTRHERLLQAALELASEHSTQVVLQRIVEIAAELTGARYAALGVIDREGWLSDFLTTGLSQEERELIGRLPQGHGILGVLIKDPRPLRLKEISRDPRSFGFPPNHPPMATFLGGPIKARGEVFGNLYLTEKEGGGEFTQDDEDTLVLLAAQAGVAIENARLFEANQQRQRRLEVSRTISGAILESSDTNEVLGLVARYALEFAEADLATISTLAGDGESLVIVAAEGQESEQFRNARIPLEGSLSGAAVQAGEPFILQDAGRDPRIHRPEGTQMPPAGPAMLLPISAGGRVFGAMAVVRFGMNRPFLEEDLAPIVNLAAQGAVALEYGRTQDQLRRLAVLEDRERIARDLHDGAIQSLFAVGMSLQATAAMAEAPDVANRIGYAVDELDRVIKELRRYIFGLRSQLSARQLDNALRRLAVDFQERSGVLTIVEVDDGVAASLQGFANEIIQLIREALSNVSRHAQATSCRVSLFRQDGMALLEVDDDGIGFDPTLPRKGMGLDNLRRRASLLGGDVELRSAPETGTCIRVLLPR